MVADPPTDRPQLSDRAEIEAAAPHERMDGVEEIATERPVAGDAAGADEGGALPREGTRFIIRDGGVDRERDRSRFGRGRSEEHTSELQSLMRISYAVFCLKKKKKVTHKHKINTTIQ